MQIDLLRIRLTDADVADLIRRFHPADAPVTDLTARITPAGVQVSGKFKHTFAQVPFQALLKLIANGAVVGVQLADLQAVGPLGGMLRSMVVKMLTDQLSKYPGVQPATSGVIVDANALLQAFALQSRLRTVNIETAAGELRAELSGSLVIDDAEKLRQLSRR